MQNQLDDNDDEIIQDGESVRVSLSMMDALDDTQKAVAKSTMLTAKLTDGRGNPAGHRPGFVFSDAVDHKRKAEQRDFSKAALAAAYKGGLQVGDRFQLGDQQMIVVGHNPHGRPQFRAVGDKDADDLIAAYDAAETALTNAWRDEDLAEGDTCIVNGQAGRVCREGGQLVCRPLRAPARRAEAGSEKPDDHEWAIAGPSSDGGQNAKDAAYAQYEQNLRDAWRR